MKTVRTQPNQSLLDIILTEYGSLEAGMQVAAANNIDISSIPMTGSVHNLPIVQSGSIDFEGTGYLRQNSVVIGTLALPLLEYMIVLKPVLAIVPNVVGDPHIIGYYSYDFTESPGFIHINPLASAYPSDNRVYYETEERYLTGHPPESSLPLSVTAMSAASIPYKLTWTVGLGYMMVWSDITFPVVTGTFEDVEGNKAYYAPLTILDNTTQDVIEHLMGDLSVALVSATASLATFRLTRSHIPILLANFREHTMEWLEAATTGTPDPLDPLNTNKTIITVGAGVHTVGIKTTYLFPGGTPSYPASAFTMVLKVL
ncbi:MAG: hypothetical protein K9G49_03710 [Taibaiella sp.]|nr:hypothetical protein [Taibaiella sp.]